ncbi:hypothetical protein HMPREF1992_01656 [Selenomonas sp. oral taxon 892 str. F0426]|jgi:hypothetical protein|uniref:DUF3084 domain-containing protein n=1 Tax=Selenomonas sp. oral taxon 892 TaxID=1321785 RepID=UPI0003ACED6F|nr:DUF3084 domain-containing protein [Selenomonas sp. oral taxon 892]ERJ90392.1 hypothetical protein HMPREF1992_01656 [Selenomonas sp. oral taxon 892 str. F0426]
MYGITLILVLAVVGGVIAFIGDRLGTRIGKKKLSIFGLRPRHTAVVVTIFTGICITTVTFGIMAAVSENVRTALFGMERLNDMIADTRAALDFTSSELSRAQTAQEKASADLKKSEEEISRLEGEQEDLRAESDRLSAGNRALMMEKEGLISLNGRLSSENAVLLADIDALGIRANELRDNILNLREGNIIYQAGEIISSGTIPSGLSHDEIERGLAGIAQLGTRNISARLGENHTDQDIWIYGPEYDAAVYAIEKSSVDMIVRIVAAGNLVRGDEIRASIELYPNRVIYYDGELILARVYRADGVNDAAEQAVMTFLREVNAAASAKGILPDPIRGTVGVIDGAEFYGLVQELRAYTGAVIISAYADGDTDAMGPLRLKFKVESEHGM